MSRLVEEWRPIAGYEGLYEVSNLGRVKSKKRVDINRLGVKRILKEKILKPCKEKNGYLRVNLWVNGKNKHYTVHRLVANAFIPNPDKLPQINHKDEDKTNNNISNLEWCTPEYNINYGNRTKKVSDLQKNDRGKSYIIDQYTIDGRYIKSYPSSKEIKRQLKIDSSNILKCCHGVYKQAYGFIWKMHPTQPTL